MAADPVAELKELLEAGTEGSVQWWASRDFADGAEPVEVALAREQCIRAYAKAVASITKEWGPPDFCGSPEVSEDGDGFVVPDDYPWSVCEFAAEVAWWRDGDWVACVWWEQRDPVMPFSVELGVTELIDPAG